LFVAKQRFYHLARRVIIQLLFLRGSIMHSTIDFGLAPAARGRAIRYNSSPLLRHGCGVSAAIPHAKKEHECHTGKYLSLFLRHDSWYAA